MGFRRLNTPVSTALRSGVRLLPLPWLHRSELQQDVPALLSIDRFP